MRSGVVVLAMFGAGLVLGGVYESPRPAHAAPQAAQDSARARQDSAAITSPAAPQGGAGVTGAAADSAAPGVAQQPRSIRDVGDTSTPLSQRLISVVGMFVMLSFGFLLSNNRRMIPWRVVIMGTALQLVFALIILKTPVGSAFFGWINGVIVGLLGYTQAGASFLFGNLTNSNVPVGTVDPVTGVFSPTAGGFANTGAFFAFNVLPTIVFFSALMTLLYYVGVMQAVVKGVAVVMMKTMRTSGAETLSAAGNIFLGQTEAPLLIKPYVATMTMSELMAVMTGGMATVAGGVMAAYVGMLLVYFPDIAGHLMAASVMSAPAALVFAKMMYPETEVPVTMGALRVEVEKIDANAIDATARGAGEGMQLALNVGAMLLAFIALIALLNGLIGWIGSVTHLADVFQNMGWLASEQKLNLESILGWVLAPLAFIMGVPWEESAQVGSLLGIKTVVNEFVGYLQLNAMMASEQGLSPRAAMIATYALCGFANFSSIAIQIGGIGGIAPSRRSDLAKLGFRAMIAGTLASFMTATIAGVLG